MWWNKFKVGRSVRQAGEADVWKWRVEAQKSNRNGVFKVEMRQEDRNRMIKIVLQTESNKDQVFLFTSPVCLIFNDLYLCRVCHCVISSFAVLLLNVHPECIRYVKIREAYSQRLWTSHLLVNAQKCHGGNDFLPLRSVCTIAQVTTNNTSHSFAFFFYPDMSTYDAYLPTSAFRTDVADGFLLLWCDAFESAFLPIPAVKLTPILYFCLSKD